MPVSGAAVVAPGAGAGVGAASAGVTARPVRAVAPTAAVAPTKVRRESSDMTDWPLGAGGSQSWKVATAAAVSEGHSLPAAFGSGCGQSATRVCASTSFSGPAYWT